jgi:hypothetical protein
MSDNLVPADLDTDLVAPFLRLTISSLVLLSGDPGVNQYTSTRPEVVQSIYALSASIAAAGVRVRDTNPGRDSFEDHVRRFTAEEIWMCDLAIDVVAMLCTLNGVGSRIRRMILGDVGILDRDVHGHHWKKQVHKAGAGPAEFRELRTLVSHHPPHPRP